MHTHNASLPKDLVESLIHNPTVGLETVVSEVLQQDHFAAGESACGCVWVGAYLYVRVCVCKSVCGVSGCV